MPKRASRGLDRRSNLDRTGPHFVSVAVLTSALLALAACGGLSVDQRSAVRDFGQASATFGDTTVAVVERLPESVARMNTFNLAMTPGEDAIDFNGPFDERDVGARILAARTIQNYAGLLLALADPSSGTLVRTEGDKFIASVEALGTNKAMSDADLDTVGTIVAGIGGVMIDREAAHALKKVVPAAHPQIVRIGELFATEFGAAGSIPTYMDAQALTLEKNATAYLKTRTAAADRMVGSQGLRLAETTFAQTEKIYPPVAETASQMVAAHAALVSALQQSGGTSMADIIAFAKGARALATSTAVLAAE
jgi:hypothetical protein